MHNEVAKLLMGFDDYGKPSVVSHDHIFCILIAAVESLILSVFIYIGVT